MQGSNYKEEGQQVLQRFHDWLQSGAPENWKMEAENHEGWRVAVDEGDDQWGWALLRASLHDPLLVLNVESETAGEARYACSSTWRIDGHVKLCDGMWRWALGQICLLGSWWELGMQHFLYSTTHQ